MYIYIYSITFKARKLWNVNVLKEILHIFFLYKYFVDFMKLSAVYI